MNTAACPVCHSVDLVTGRCLSQMDLIPRFVFRPDGLRFLAITGTDLSITSALTACLNCGHLWSVIRHEKLIKVIARKGGKKLKDRLVHRLVNVT